MRTMLSIGTRWLVNHKRRYILCIFVIALSVACMVLFYSVGSGVRKSVVRYSSASALYRNIMIDRTGSRIRSMFDMGGLYSDLQESIGKEIDLVTSQTLEQASTKGRFSYLFLTR